MCVAITNKDPRVHRSLTLHKVTNLFERTMHGCENLGACIKCGHIHTMCEPDAERYRCGKCGERKVYGVASLVLGGMFN